MSVGTLFETVQVTRPTNTEAYTWWNSLRHHRLLLSGTALQQCFAGNDPSPLYPKRVEDIAFAYRKFQLEPSAESLTKWLEIAVHDAIGSPSEHWTKGPSLGSAWTVKGAAGENVRPRWVWEADTPEALPLFVTEGSRSIGVGRGRRDHARILDWLRAQKRDLAIVTNGKQWRLIFATETTDAWCESDVEQWFAENGQGSNLEALRLLLSDSGITTLREAIRETRKGHAELSKVLGERVRQAIEVLVEGSQHAINELFSQPENTVRLDHVYQAATRVAMRLVVVMFAESRQLLSSPSQSATRDAYWESYSLQGLRLLLEQETLSGDRANTAWPRILALFNLLYNGSTHKDLTRRAYGGRLFEPGDPNSSDPILRALAAFERTDSCPTDSQILEALKLMAYAPVKMRQGRAATWSVLPVDFSQLDVEYVGILYEGLLDYELHRVGVDEPVVFLNVGVQPVLPLSRLEQMSDAALKEMVKELSKKEKAGNGEEEAEGGEEDEVEDEEESEETEELTEQEISEAEPEIQDDAFHVARTRALEWAKRAVVAAGIVKNPKGKNPNNAANEEATQKAARGLISRIAVPGELYLVRHGGTRKGSGTFYTKPQLAEPTVARTLEPLVYEGEIPRDPETILAVKVCDPACGSGSFLVSSLRYMTRALYEAICAHQWIIEHPDGRISWEDPQGARPTWFKEALKDFRGLNERPDAAYGQSPRERVEAQLLRVVAERCVYGVDLNPLAVELAKLSLWIATMDPNLRFSFLDHKLKVGNGLVGCWFDRFQDYPVLAWVREGGDKTHGTWVHHEPGTWTKAIKAKLDTVKQEMREVLSGQTTLFVLPVPPETAHQEAVAAYGQLHAATEDPDAQAEAYRAWRSSPGFQSLKDAFDSWCALWFWPADALDLAPMPREFGNLSEETRVAVREVAETNLFFHWELEFPDVFDGENSGFAAMVGNPPWETLQPNSKEFFSNLDPLYRTYGKQPALAVQRGLFGTGETIEQDWIAYNALFKAYANWQKNAGAPFGDPLDGESLNLVRSSTDAATYHATWRRRRATRSGYADTAHPYRVQGEGKPYTYKLFLEQAHALLRPSGRLGLIVPSGIYSDRGSDQLRRLFLDRCQWEWLFGFENRNKVFDIDSRFKFCPLVVQKGGTTVEVQTAFMRRELDDWSRPERFAIGVTREQIARFSPKSMAFLEVQDERDVQVLEKMTANGIPLGDDGPDGWGVKYQQGDFNMTSDSKLFPPRERWEARGFRPDEYGHWLLGEWVPISEAPAGAFDEPGWVKSRDGIEAISIEAIKEVALPLYEGRMIGQFDFSQKGWVSGKGRTAVWRDIPWESKQIEPQYLLGQRNYSIQAQNVGGYKLQFMDITSSTNTRTMTAGAGVCFPGNHRSPILFHPTLVDEVPQILGIFNSFVFDFDLRNRIGGTAIVWATLQQCVVPLRTHERFSDRVTRISLSLIAGRKLCPASWLLHDPGSTVREALSIHERLRLRCILDAAVAYFYGLNQDDFRWIMRDCDHPVSHSTNNAFTRALNAKGFWRVEKTQPPDLRHTVLAQVAFDDLQALIAEHGDEQGMKRFLGSGSDDGWMLPETLRLADYGLGHDDRAETPQPVASVLGPRFYDWQLNQTSAEAWAETQRHAENLRLIRAVGVDEEGLDDSGSKSIEEQNSLF